MALVAELLVLVANHHHLCELCFQTILKFSNRSCPLLIYLVVIDYIIYHRLCKKRIIAANNRHIRNKVIGFTL